MYCVVLVVEAPGEIGLILKGTATPKVMATSQHGDIKVCPGPDLRQLCRAMPAAVLPVGKTGPLF